MEGQSVLLTWLWRVHMSHFWNVLLTEKHLLANLTPQHLSRLYQSSAPVGWEIFPERVFSFPFTRKLLSTTLLGNKTEALRRLNHTFCCQLVFLISSICSTLFYEFGYNIPSIPSCPECAPIKNLCATSITLIYLQYIITGCMFTSMSSLTRPLASWGQELCFIHLWILKGRVWHRPNLLHMEQFYFHLWWLKHLNTCLSERISTCTDLFLLTPFKTCFLYLTENILAGISLNWLKTTIC